MICGYRIILVIRSSETEPTKFGFFRRLVKKCGDEEYGDSQTTE